LKWFSSFNEVQGKGITLLDMNQWDCATAELWLSAAAAVSVLLGFQQG